MEEFDTPILFIVFNRIDTTKEVFGQIQKIKPKKLYIAADGPRERISSEHEKTKAVQNYILKNINWDCEIKTRFNKENLGCKVAVSTAITWFFTYENKGIILEDDVLPNNDFFDFIQNNLIKYENDERVMMITGTNYLEFDTVKVPYFFSEHFSIWGWGTWKRAWEKYDVTMKLWEDEKVKRHIRFKYSQKEYIWKSYYNKFNSLKTDYKDTWDIQWVFTCIMNHGLAVTPGINLISNIGTIGTHGKTKSEFNKLKTGNLPKSTYEKFNPLVCIDYDYDALLHDLVTKKNVRYQYFKRFLIKLRIFIPLKKLHTWALSKL